MTQTAGPLFKYTFLIEQTLLYLKIGVYFLPFGQMGKILNSFKIELDNHDFY